MSYFDEVYLKRLNRYGLDYQSRLQGQRERNFDDYLLKTVYRVDFEYGGKLQPGSLERYKQDYSETQAYLLTKRDLVIPNGTVLQIISQDGSKRIWMIWWLEQIESSGYNKYVILKMTHELTWVINDSVYTQWAYFYGPGTSKISDAIKSSTGQALYTENNNLHMFITPFSEGLKREAYFEVSYEDQKHAYTIEEIDVNSTPGVAYVSVDPVLLRVDQIVPNDGPSIKAEDYWLNGG